MKPKIFQFFPYLALLCGVDGISSSEAQRKKEANKNEAEKLLLSLKVNEQRLFQTKREILTSTGDVKTSITEMLNPHSIEDYKHLEVIQSLYSESSVLGAALTSIEEVRNYLTINEVNNLGRLFNMKFEGVLPVEKKAVIGNINDFCNLDRIETMIKTASASLIAIVGNDFIEGLKIEAKAAVLGNQYAKPDCLIRKVSTLENKEQTTTNTNNMIVYSQSIVGINKNEFAEFEKELGEIYTTMQKKRNAIVKTIKDAARELENKYKTEYRAALNQYNIEKQQYEAIIEKERAELLIELSTLKILA